MPEANLSKQTSIDTSKDSIVIIGVLEVIAGGRTLDVTGVAEEVLNAGHIIIKETSSGNLKPHPVSGGTYDALPASHTYEGVLVASILKDKPMASVMVRGSVNEVASPFPVLAGAKTALSLIRFTQD